MLMLLLTIIGALGGIVLAGFYAGMETAAYSASLPRVEYLAATETSTLPRRILPFLRNLSYLVTITLVGHNVAVYVSTYITGQYLESHHIPNTEFWATVVLTPFCFILAETMPKNLARIHAGDYCIAGANIMVASRWLFLPMTKTLGLVGALFHRFLGASETPEDAESSREEILALLEAGIAMGGIDQGRRSIAQRIMSIEAMPVESLGIPLTSAITAKTSTSLEGIITLIRESGHHHIPVYERHPDHIVGIITLRDLILSDNQKDATAAELMHHPITISRTASISKALAKLQRCGEHVGILIDPTDDQRAIGIISIVDIVSHILDAEQDETAVLASALEKTLHP